MVYPGDTVTGRDFLGLKWNFWGVFPEVGQNSHPKGLLLLFLVDFTSEMLEFPAGNHSKRVF